ncbi:type IV secretion protein Rhs [Actinocatenispora thailandica]|uniref:Type IV secretion protein Rhs n=1 Tax=Actinocatenispora thailandica TaxID=227318 RepID=A0A7R7DST3_9ACTN|nr:phage baseplate assembly protein V [Actinocatenispora thailandica]BCJ37199.1 type IV secretion protein Rhs [Actinocatenispora thailandica]
MSTPTAPLDGTAFAHPVIRTGMEAAVLPAAAADRIRLVAVDSHLTVPDMFEIRFRDPDGAALRIAGLALGTPIQVWGPDTAGGSHRLIAGEITTVEGSFVESSATTVVRGYTLDHRLQRARRTRTFLQQKDSEIARQVATDAGLAVGRVDATPDPVHYVVQANQTDWEFLCQRAREIGYELGVADDGFYFRRRSTVDTATPLRLRYGAELRRLFPRVTAGNLAPQAEVRVWDPLRATTVSAQHEVANAGATTVAGPRAARFAGAFVPPTRGPEPAHRGVADDLGPAPNPQANVVTTLALPLPGGSDAAAATAARSAAARWGSTQAEADGECLGDARIQAGCVVQLDRLPGTFAGRWLLSGARHIFDTEVLGYRTSFTASGTQDRSLLTLARADPCRRDSAATVDGVVCGVVTNINDPEQLGRVKVSLPWLSPAHESDWSPTGQLFAGTAEGALFLPSPGDQVLVAFEHGDVRRPYVLSSLASTRTGYGLAGGRRGRPGNGGVHAAGESGAVARRGLITPAGNVLAFHDEVPPNGKGKPLAADLTLGSADGQIGLCLDQVAGSVALRCSPDRPGLLTIECNGSIEIRSGAAGTVTIDGGSRLILKGKTVEIDGAGPVAVKGKPIQLN